MDLTNLSYFDTSSKKMDWLAARQKTVAENVANADTPGYIGRDVESFEDFLSRHDSAPSVSEADNSWAGSFDGNKVVLEEQALLSSSIAGEYSLASKLYRKGHNLIAIAAGRK